MRTRITNLLGIDHPILNAPMAMVAGAALASAVSEGGGLGVIGGAFRDADGLRSEIRAARELTDRRFAVGFISHLPEAEELMGVALDEGVSVIAHSFADPTPFVASAHDAGALVFCQVRTVAEAETAAAAGVDVVVAQGTEAGGHTGQVSTLPLVPAVIDAIAPIPVVAAGGIADARGVAAALMLGADGVWMGTRFECCPEARIPSSRQERILAASTDDTVLTTTIDLTLGLDWPAGIAMRTIRNRFTDEWHGREDEISAWTDDERNTNRTRILSAPEDAPLTAGEAAGLIDSMEPAAALVQRLARETDNILMDRTTTLLA